MIKPRCILLLAFLSMTACEQQPSVAEHTIIAFGTLIDITLYNVEPQLADKAFKQLEEDFHRYHAAWTPWEPGSLTRTNQLLATGGSFSTPPSVLPLIQQSTTLYQTSEGLFNPAIGNLIRLWQMHKHDEPDIKPPKQAEIEAMVKQNPSMSDLQLDGLKLHSNNTHVALNFGAFAKGYAIDRSFEQLHKLGIHNAIINAGGDLRVNGTHGKRPWRIGIRHPRQESTLAWIDARDGESIFTSGDYERYYMYQGQRYHHILDPRTGYPASSTASVTVIHDNAGEADAAATALFIAGPEHWPRIAKSMGIRYVMLIDSAGKVHMNPKMLERVHFSDDQIHPIRISQAL